jgi:hypothetical protein
MKGTSSILDRIPNVKIDPHGVFKYIQIFIRNPSDNESKHIVRGAKKFSYHADNYDAFVSK